MLVVRTDKPVAIDSPDHIRPHGTVRDNSFNFAFNAKVYGIVSDPVSVLDLGCAGGAMVRSFLEQSAFAVGIEGCDYNKVHQRAEWATVPQWLFTADITAPFSVERGNGERILFKVITAWDVIEHIRESDLAAVLSNIHNHLAPGGLVVMSISTAEEVIQGVTLHQTVKDRQWWLDLFAAHGWRNQAAFVEYFGVDFVRGGLNAPHSFHVVLTREGDYHD